MLFLGFTECGCVVVASEVGNDLSVGINGENGFREKRGKVH